MNTIRRVFTGAGGRLRPIWRAGLFLAAVFAINPLLDWPFNHVAQWLHFDFFLSPGAIALNELENFVLALICTGAFALYERRRVDSYGLPIDRVFSRQTLEGLFAGTLLAGAVALGMLALGGMKIRGLALADGTLATYAFAWLGANICVGVAEEFLFRSYFQQTLWKAIGFWPSATVIALLFAADHYFF